MTSHTIDSIDVLSMAKILGVVGVLWGIVLSVGWLTAGLLGAGSPGLPELVAPIVGGLVYGVVAGAVTALVYNAAASLIGGIEIELASLDT